MCEGIFSDGKPVVYAQVFFPAHLEEPPSIPPLEFLVDTGAEGTLISVTDAHKLGIEYKRTVRGLIEPFFGGEKLDKGPGLGGIGGGIASYEVKDVLLVFVTQYENCFERHVERLSVVYVPEGKAKGVPNLLGWDILSRFRLSCCITESSLELSRVKTPGSYLVEIVPTPTSA